MAHMIKVAEPDELPPGKGKTLHIEGRDVTVYNTEGRYVATATWSRQAIGIMESSCDMPGRKFDVGIEHSPARLRTDELHYQVLASEDGVFVLVEEGHVHHGEERRLPRSNGNNGRQS